jgi:hypothetical protein
MNATKFYLDISDISEELYDLLLAEFSRQHGYGLRFDNWEISATIAEGEAE